VGRQSVEVLDSWVATVPVIGYDEVPWTWAGCPLPPGALVDLARSTTCGMQSRIPADGECRAAWTPLFRNGVQDLPDGVAKGNSGRQLHLSTDVVDHLIDVRRPTVNPLDDFREFPQ
jgi:hypothetical protein